MLCNTFSKKIFVHFSSPLTHLYNLSLQTASIPYQWKNAIVMPVFKKGSRNLPQNYHPISLICAIYRVFENIIADKLYTYLYT